MPLFRNPDQDPMFGRKNRAKAHRRQPRRKAGRGFRPVFEFVEDRTLLSTVNWVGPATGGDWDNPSNWLNASTDMNAVPGPTDDAVIDLSSTGVVTMNNGDTDAINSLTTNANTTISIGGDTLNVGSASTLDGALALSSGVLNSAGMLIVNGPMTWSGGTISGSGSVNTEGALSLTGNDYLSGGTVSAYGITTLSSGGLFLDGNATFNNEPGATFDVTSNSSIYANNNYTEQRVEGIAAGTFNNQGLLQKTSVTGESQIGAGYDYGGSFSFNQLGTGSVDVETGDLALIGGGTLGGTGQLTAESGATLTLASGTSTLISTSAITGAGTVEISGGSLTVDGEFTPAALTVDGGTFDDESTSATSVSSLTFSSGAITGADPLTVTGSASWSGGDISSTGAVDFQGSLALTGDDDISGGTVNAYGITTLSSGGLFLDGNATFNNEPGATFDITGNSSIYANNNYTERYVEEIPAGTFNNEGLLQKTSVTGESQIGAGNHYGGSFSFNQVGTGSVDVETGDLALIGGGTLDGTGQLSAGATLTFASGPYTLTTTSAMSGAGTIEIAGGSLNVVSTSVLDCGLGLSSGALVATGQLIVDGPMTWSGGTISGSGEVSVYGTFDLAGNEELSGGTVNAYGITTLSSGGLFLDGSATLNNEPGATFDITDSSSIYANNNYTERYVEGIAAGTFNNQGLLQKTSVTGESQIGAGNHYGGSFSFNQLGAGSVDVETGDLALIGGGTLDGTGQLTAESGATLTFASGSYTLTSTSAITGAGTVEISGGSLTVDGAFTPVALAVDGGTFDDESTSATSVSALTLSSGTITGANPLTVTGSASWSGGDVSSTGAVAFQGSLALTGNDDISGGTVNAYGITTLSSGGLFLDGNASFNNEPGAAFDITDSSSIYANNNYTERYIEGIAAGTFNNQGLLQKTSVTGESQIGAGNHYGGSFSFNQVGTGSVDVETGDLALIGGGTLDGTGQLSAGATLTFASGPYTLTTTSAMSGAGTIEIAGGSLNVTTSVLDCGLSLSSGALNVTGQFTVNGSTTWSGGTISGSGAVNTEGALELTGNDYLSSETVNAYGITTLSSGGLFLDGNSAFNNEPGAAFDITGNSSIYANNNYTEQYVEGIAAGTFNNQGLLQKTSVTGESQIGAGYHYGGSFSFNQLGTGSVDVQTGDLALFGGGTLDGTGQVVADSGATLTFASGSYTLTATSAITGAGTVEISGGSLTVDGAFSPAGLTIDGGTLDDESSSATSVSTLTLISGTLTSADPLTVTTLNMSGGTLTGFPLLTVTTSTDWTGGTIRGGGIITTEGTLTLGDPTNQDAEILTGVTLDNAAVATLSNYYGFSNYYGLYLYQGSVFDNEAGASFTFETNARIDSDGTGSIFQNDGIVTQSVGATGNSYIDSQFNQTTTGSTEAQAGGLVLDGGGTSTGPLTADVGAMLQFNGGTFNLDSFSTITGTGSVYFTGGTINDGGAYTVTGATVLTNGTLDFDGGQAISLPTLDMSGGTLTGFSSLTVTTSTDWTGGTITGGGTITTEGTLTLGDPSNQDAEVLTGVTLDNAAVATLSNYYGFSNYYGLYLYQGSVFDNEDGASFTFDTNARINSDGTGSVFQNDGIVTQSVGATGNSYIDSQYNQTTTGSTEAQAGGLVLDGGGTSTGPLTADVGAVLQFNGGTFNLDSFSTITGTGSVYFTGGTINDGGAYTVTGATELTNGTLDFDGGQAISLPTLDMSGGTLTGFSSLTVTTSTDWTGGTITGGGTITTEGTLTLGDPTNQDAEVLTGVTLDNAAVATLSNYYGFSNYYGLYLYQGSVFDNEDGASFTFDTNARINSDGTGSVFQNDGIVTQSVGATGNSYIDSQYNQTTTGSTEAQAGGLVLDGGGTSTGPLTADVGAVLQFNGGTFNLDSFSTITGPGSVYFTGGTINDGGAYTVTGATVLTNGTLNFDGGQAISLPTLEMSGGTLTGFPLLTVTTSTDWTGGTITGGGIITTEGTLTLGDPTNQDAEILTGVTLDNAAVATLSNYYGFSNYYGLYLYQGSVFDNEAGASFTFDTNARINSDGTGSIFENDGIVTQSTSATGNSYIDSAFNQSATGSLLVPVGTIQLNGSVTNAGTFEATAAGALYTILPPTNLSSGMLTGGIWIVGSGGSMSLDGAISTDAAIIILDGPGATLSGLDPLSAIASQGSLEILDGGSFTTSGDLDNAGMINLAPGTLDVTGNYTQESSGAFDVGVGGLESGGEFGQLNVTSMASLAGSLSVSLLDGYAPPPGDSYPVLTFANETGDFTAEFGLYFGDGAGFAPTYSPTSSPTELDLDVISELAGSQTSIQSSENASNFGDSVTFTATVSPVISTSFIPTGTVTFYDGAQAIDTETLSGGTASFTTSTLIAGAHPITLQYSGDSNFSGSNSQTLTQVVNQVGSTASVSTSVDPSVYGDQVTFTANVASAVPGLAAPTGTVTFFDGSTPIDTETLSAGMATYSTSSLDVGGHSITVQYGGDTNFLGSSSPSVTQTVEQTGSTTALQSSVNPTNFGDSVTFTATVSSTTPGLGTPTGQVTFFDGASAIDTETLYFGSATFTTSALGIGDHMLTAKYLGDSTFSTSMSTVFTQTVIAPPPATLNGTIFNDLNGDGSFEGGEPGLSGWTVNLIDASSTTVATTTTDASGNYSFTSVLRGTYTIAAIPPGGGYIATGPASGTLSVSPGAGQTIDHLDFGEFATVTLGGEVFTDTTGNGVLGAGDSGLAGWTVNLVNSSSLVVNTTTTDTSGNYTIGNVGPGVYSIQVTEPSGYVVTTGVTALATTSGDNVTGLNVGEFQTVTLGGEVFGDLNGDGTLNGADAGLAGWTVDLIDGGNQTVATTDSSGDFSFTGVGPGSFTIKVVSQSGYLATTANVKNVSTISGQNQTTFDFGQFQTVSLSGEVYSDVNSNGQLDSGEPGLVGWTVQLLNSANHVIATTTTDASGDFAFSGVGPGTHTIDEVVQTGYIETTSPVTVTLATTSGQNVSGLNFGDFQVESLSGKVFTDTNGNGSLDSGEQALASVTVALLDSANHTIATAVTGANGLYAFTIDAPGSYSVQEVVPSGYELTDPVGGSYSESLSNGQAISGLNFGNFQTVSLQGEVYADNNGNGTLDGGEPGLAGWSVQLIDSANQVVNTTTTSSSGSYTFSTVGAGVFTIQVVPPSGYVATSPTTLSLTTSSGQNLTGNNFGEFSPVTLSGEVFADNNGDGALDNSESGLSGFTVNLLNSSSQIINTATTLANGQFSFTDVGPGTYTVQVVAKSPYVATTATSQITVTSSGQNLPSINFGEFEPVTFSGDVFNDTNGNGALDSGESGLSGWTVTLLNGSTQVGTTTTDATGAFAFAGVGPAFSYTLQVTPTIGYVATGPTSLTVSPSSGQIVASLNFAEFKTVSISGEVFNDLTDSGNLQVNDPGLAGWVVELLNSSSQVVATATSDAAGDYSFADVGPGSFTVDLVLQPGFVQSAPASGGLAITTSGGTNLSAENFGIVPGASLAVTGLRATSPSGVQSGASLLISWSDTNTGDSPVAESFTDHVVITNLTSGQVLGVADVPYDLSTRGRLGGGLSAAQQYTFRLPDGNPGVGNIQVSVIADDYDTVSGGLSTASRSATITTASALANYADLAPSAIVAPVVATPGQTVTVSWLDSNVGNASTVSPWADQILLSYDGTVASAIPVGSIAVNAPIAAGASAPEHAMVTIPISGTVSAGSLQFVILDNATGSFFELNTTNNATIDATPTAIPLALTLTSPVTSIAENSANPTILAHVSRNGPTDQPLIVTLTSADTTGFTVPATVTIAAGETSAAVPITVLDDGIVDADRAIAMTASAAGFQPGQTTITDINTDESALTVSFATSPATVAKGSFIAATVTRTGSDDQAVTVALSTNTPNKIYVPATVMIPAGAASAAFSVQAINDDEIEGTQSYAFTAAAQGLVSAVADVTVTDSNVPNLTLSLTQTTLVGIAGDPVTGTITRTPAGDLPLVVNLSVPAGSPITVPATVTIPANQSSVTFPIGTIADNNPAPIQSIPISAFVTTMTDGTSLTQGSVSATINVVNPNSPFLSVTFANPVVNEGLTAATTGTVSIVNGTALTSPLTVALTTTDATSATVPATVTIPAGATSATFTIATPIDTLHRGTVEPVIGASAPSYNAGQTQLIVTDTALPDLIVANPTTSATALNGQIFSVSYTVTNQGTAAAFGPWQDTVYISDAPNGGTLTPLGTPVDFNGTMQPGQSYSRSLSFFAPEETGAYWIIVKSNSGNQLVEAEVGNGTAASVQSMQVLPSYTATVAAGVSVAAAGTPIPLSGTATLAGGGPAQFQLVNIHIFSAATERIISALSDQNGNFSTAFQPLPGEAGVYTIGATNPGVSQAMAQGGFDIIGMNAQPASASLSLIEGAGAVGGQVTLTDLTPIPLSDLTAQVEGAPSNLSVAVTLGNGKPGQGLAGSSTLSLSYSATASDVSIPSGSFTIHVTSGEGASVDIPVSFTVVAIVPDVVASPSSLQAGMLIGSQTIVQLTLTNQGGAASGPLQVLLPAQSSGSAFLSLASSASIASLDPGATTQITLLLTPPSGLALGYYAGSIVVQGAYGNTSIPFKFLNQSSAVGGLDLTAVDEFTYYEQGSPRVAGANVTITNSLTGEVAFSGQTDSSGVLDVAALPEGYYQIHATADGHTPYDGTVVVSAGQTTPVTAFLSLQLVQTSFTLAPTSVQDNIQVQVDTTFETNVPAPVITASPSVFDVGGLTELGQTSQVNLTITNHGLVAALNMALNFGSHPYYSITPLISSIGTLPADSSLTIPVILKRISVTDTGDAACSMTASLSWQLLAGTTYINYESPLAVINVKGDCAPGSPGPVLPIIGGEGPTSPGNIGSGVPPMITVTQPIAVSSSSSCDGCETATTAALLQYTPFADWESLGTGLGSALAGGATNVVADAAGFISGLTAFMQANPDIGEAVSLIDTAQAAVAACLNSSGDSGSTSVTTARDQLQAFADGFQSLVNESVDIFGSSDWINAYSGPQLTGWLAAFAADATGGQAITPVEATALEGMTLPEEVSATDLSTFIARWNQTIAYNAQGVYDSGQVPGGGSTNFIPRSAWASDLQATDAAFSQVQAVGSTSFSAAILYAMNQLNAAATVSTPSTTVCALVKLEIDQQVVVTRSAFDATLQIEDHKTTPISDIGLTIVVHDARGNDVTNLFSIATPNLTGLTAVDGTGTLDAGADGQAVFTIIPTNAAAPTASTFYYVSAVLHYQVAGINLAIPFSPETITVLPNPSLTLRYFEQSAVYGPDPTNPSEPSQPFVLGVQVINSGGGTANGVSITSAQPQIVANGSGLLANFQVIATQVDGQSLTPSLTANFGSILPGAVAEGTFLLESSIQGQFVSYNATFQDDSGLGTPQLSIINGVQIFNLVHLASEVGAGVNTGNAFLVADMPGASALPDAVYLPDGSVASVGEATNPVITGSLGNGTLQVQLADTTSSGWNYLDIADPGQGKYQLIGVTRSDGTSLPANDFWQTDRTFVSDGQPPVYENRLHILDDNGTGSYTLDFAPINAVRPTVTNIAPVSPNPTITPVNSLDVTFNEPIDLSTFDASALSLTLNNGPNLISGAVTISPLSGSTYQISGLSGLDAASGVYILTINAAGIQDTSGNPGTGTGFTSWVMASTAPAVSIISGVNPGSRNTPVSSVSVTFTEPIDPSSFTLSALSLTEDGGANLIDDSSGISITQQGTSTFQVTGLGGLTTTDGNYVLTVDATQIQSLGNEQGVGAVSASWTMDTTPPLVQSFSSIFSPRNTAIDEINVVFSKPIDPSTFTTSALSLTNDGSGNLITRAVSISQVSGSTYQIAGLSSFDMLSGTYNLTVLGSSIVDLAGNAGTNSLSTSWVIDTMPPTAPSNLAISPDNGVSAADGLTNTGAVTLSGAVSAAAVSVDVFNLTTNTDLGNATISGGSFAILLNLVAGANELRVTDTDAAQNVSVPAFFNAFIDETPPTASAIVAVSPNPRNTVVSSVDVTFSKPINPATFTTADLSLTDNGGPNLITSAVVITLVPGTTGTYQIGNLDGLQTADGNYSLSVITSGIEDNAGNAGTGSLSTSWLLDTTAPSSTISPLAAQTTSTSFYVSAGGTDPNGPNNSAPSGIATFTLYDSANGGAFAPFATVTPADPSATFSGQVGVTYGFYSVATDNAGNTQPAPTSAQETVEIVPPLSVSSIAAVSPSTRNSAVSSIDATFSVPINVAAVSASALTLTDDDGPNLITGAVSLSLVSGTTYQINGVAGLTTAEGQYTLTVNAAGIADVYGNTGVGTLSTEWLMDTTPPTSTVSTLPAQTTSTSFVVSASGSDPGTNPSGIAYYTLFDAVDTGAYTAFATIQPGSASATFAGQVGHSYHFFSLATDNAGNTQPVPSSPQQSVQIVAPVGVSAIAGVTPNPRNTAVGSITVSFTEPINPASLSSLALTLTDNGGPNLITSGVSLALVSGSTYQVNGLSSLTAANGQYSFTVNAAGLEDTYGNSGTGSASTLWLMDATPPTSTVSPLPARESTLTFPVSISASDAGSPASGLALTKIYDSTNGGPWYYFTTLIAPATTASFTGQSNTTYSFYSVAEDYAGNVENRAPVIQASTYVPNLAAPVTSVNGTTGAKPSTVNTSTGLFTLNLTGTDPGGGQIEYFLVYVKIDNGSYQELGPYAIPAGASSGGTWNSSITYQGLTDGASHTYSFYSVGLDSNGNQQSAPTSANVTFANQVFAVPSALQVTGFTVEHGSPGRSFVEYLDIGFNQTGNALTNIANSISTSTPLIQIYKYSLTGDPSTKTAVPLNTSPTIVDVIDHAIEINFGSGGIGGAPASTTPDGYYEVDIKLPSGQTSVHHFYRLLGDVDGDQIVDQNDLNEVAASIAESAAVGWAPLSADVTGGGTVTTLDLTVATRSKGHALKSGLSLG